MELQQDSHELMLNLLGKFGDDTGIGDLFELKLQTIFSDKEGEIWSTVIQPASELNLNVINENNQGLKALGAALQYHFAEENMEGANAYYACPTSTTIKKASLATHPKVTSIGRVGAAGAPGISRSV